MSSMPIFSAFRHARPNALTRQQRLLLETAWEALEDAGQDVRKLDGTRPAFLSDNGSMTSRRASLPIPRSVDFYMAQGSGRYASSGRISYVLGLRGPSLTIDTACSSSLVAVHLAVQSIRSGESNIALAGGTNIILQPQISIAYSQSRMMAVDGRCKFGDASADGYVRSEGVALIFLKALDRAMADGDRIYAVIRGSAINNDGRSSGSMGTPSQIGQEELLRSAYRDAGLSGRQRGLYRSPWYRHARRRSGRIRCPGCGARRGARAGTSRFCWLGQDQSSGTPKQQPGWLALSRPRSRCIMMSFRRAYTTKHPIQLIPWADLPLVIPCRRMSWPRGDGPRIAGVSGFGIAGTNAHVVLEEAPANLAAPNVFASRSTAMLPLPRRAPTRCGHWRLASPICLSQNPVQPSMTSAGMPPRDGRPWNIARSLSRRIVPQCRTSLRRLC